MILSDLTFGQCLNICSRLQLLMLAKQKLNPFKSERHTRKQLWCAWNRTKLNSFIRLNQAPHAQSGTTCPDFWLSLVQRILSAQFRISCELCLSQIKFLCVSALANYFHFLLWRISPHHKSQENWVTLILAMLLFDEDQVDLYVNWN